MKCNACGQEILDTAVFCAYCGAKQVPPTEDAATEVETIAAVLPEPEPIVPAVEEIPIMEEALPTEEDAFPAPEEAAVCEETPVEEAEPVICQDTVPAEAEPVILEEAPVEEQPVVITEEASTSPAMDVQPVYVPPVQPVYVPPVQPVYTPPQPAYAPPQPTYTPPQPTYTPPQHTFTQPQPSYVQPQPVYVPPVRPPVQTPVTHHSSPAWKLPTGRSLGKMFWLGLLTGNLYKHVILSRIPEELNMVASRRDGRRTQQYFWMLMLSSLTLGIYPLCWFHGLCNRISGEMKHRRINYDLRPAHFWLWYILYFFVGSLLAVAILAVFSSLRLIPYTLLMPLGIVLHLCTLIGPWIFTHKLMRAMNLINQDYNLRG